MEKIDEIKPPSPYHRNIQEILQIESKYDVEHWYESLKEFTFPTYFLPLFANEAKAICNQYKYRFLKGDKIKENDILLLENVKTRINLAMKQYFGEKPIFLRLSTRSPKDSALDFSNSKTNEKYLQGISEILIKMGISNISLQERMKQSQSEKMDTDYFLSLLSDEESNAILVYLMNATKTTLKVSTSFEALQLLTSSERVVIDIHHMLVYKNCDEKESDLELCKIVLREWVDLNDLDEFRCFFFQKKLTAISQYNFYIYDKSLKENTEYIKQRIYEEFMKLVSYLNVENGVIDFAVQKNRTWLIELNPFNDYKGAGTGGALFFWKEDINIIKNGPLEIRVVEKLIPNCSHRISIFGAENLVVQSLKSILENNSKKNNQSDDLEFGSPVKKCTLENENLETLLPKKKKEKKHKDSITKRLFEYLFPSKQTIPRKIHFSGEVYPPNYFKNKVENTKYSILSFVPAVLYNQFKFFFNMFYLLLSISQFFETLKVGLLFTYIAPLAFVLFLTMLKEAYDDFKRYSKDKEANSTKYRALTPSGMKYKPSSNLKVGDIIEINANQRVPADLLLLHTSDSSGNIFIRTDQLDGETDWKLRKPVIFTQSYLSSNPITSLLELPCYIKASQPIENIYKFEGVFVGRLSLQEKKEKEGLNLENTLWANTVLTAGKIFALVLYTGKESRICLNSEAPRTKIGKLDKELNFLSKLLFIFMVVLSIVLEILSARNWNLQRILIDIFRNIILVSSIIPISMRVNLDFAKIFYCFNINKDKEIEGTIARNSAIPEELGRIEFLLTDKTGTLTQNEMIFKRISLENMRYSQYDIEKITKNLIKSCKYKNQLNITKNTKIDGKNSETKTKDNICDSSSSKGSEKSLYFDKKIPKRDKNFSLLNMVKAMALCHNVTPIYEEDYDLDYNYNNSKANEIQIPVVNLYNTTLKKKSFQASSPDEVSLVQTAEKMGFDLCERTQNTLKINNPGGFEENFKILANFPFSSEKKRMGIILQSVETQSIVFYLKGADVAMKNLIPAVKRGFLMDECDNLAKEGLRTLVLTQKIMTQEQYDSWRQDFEDAQTNLENREEGIRKIIDKLEQNMDLLGITGVEDKLQEDVCATLENLRSAGIHIWMLTGDKLETAQCVAISAGLRSIQQEVFVIKEIESKGNLKKVLEEYEEIFKNNNNVVIVIDGISLKTAFDFYPKRFFEVASKAPSVICCRCSPTQKSLITEGIKIYCKKQTAAVGDGGNDVGMIQKADVGIGLKGKEGMQAALASDFSIEKFKYLNKLLLWHGRLSYKRSANLSQFVIHRGLIISIIQAIFMVMFYFVPISIYSGMLLLGYSTAFTILPVFSLIFDQDIDVSNALKYPPLYKTLQKGRELNVKTFMIWISASIFQGVMIMIISLYVFSRVFIDIVTITFTTLILTEFSNIYTSINNMHVTMVISQIFSVILYFCTVVLMKNLFMVSTLTWEFLLKILLLTFITWFPLHLIKLIKKYLDPSDYQKIMISHDNHRSVFMNFISLTFESNFTFNKNELNRITIPSQMYYDQEAFFLGLDNSINIQFPLISLNQFCHAENFDLMVQNVASFINYESYYKNPEFLMIENIMLFIDQSRILRVFRLDETTDSYVYEISQQDISEEINGLTFLRMFYNKDLKKIFMLIDNSVVIFSLNDYRKPQKEKKIILEESKLPIQAFYKSDCFYLLMDDHIDICVYCFINNLTEIKKEININEELLSKLIGKTITNIQDLALDENILYLCEKNIGMIILNVTDKKNISLLYIDDKAHIEKIALFEKSLTIIRSLPIENGLLQNYLEEYFIDSSIENNFVTILNRNLTLNHSSIISMHISNKYIFLLQDNQIKIYRHSIPNKLFTNNNDFLISVFAKDILALEKAPNMGKNDIILAVFGSEIKLYKIKKLNPKLICIPDDSTPNNLHYKINFYILTQTCRYKNETLWLDGYFSYCNYSNHLNVFVTNKEENGFTSWSITIGFLVAIIILGFFLISALVFFFCYYETLKYKIKKMKENKLYNNVNKEESIDRKQGDIEHKEIELQIN